LKAAVSRKIYVPKKKIADTETLYRGQAENPREIFKESKENGRIGSKEKYDRNQPLKENLNWGGAYI